MENAQLRYKKVNPAAIEPAYAHDGDSGFDLYATEDVIITPGSTEKVPTGLAFELPEGYELQVRPKSGISTRTKLRVTLGTVDSNYRGEVSVMVDNIAPIEYEIVCMDDVYELWEKYHDALLTSDGSGDSFRRFRSYRRSAVGQYVPYSERDEDRTSRPSAGKPSGICSVGRGRRVRRHYAR